MAARRRRSTLPQIATWRSSSCCYIVARKVTAQGCALDRFAQLYQGDLPNVGSFDRVHSDRQTMLHRQAPILKSAVARCTGPSVPSAFRSRRPRGNTSVVTMQPSNSQHTAATSAGSPPRMQNNTLGSGPRNRSRFVPAASSPTSQSMRRQLQR